MTENRKKRSIVKYFAATAAVLVVIVGAITGFSIYRSINAIDSVISFDVNPSIELEISRDEKVIRANPINSDAEKVLGDMELKGSHLDVAVNAIIGSMVKEGFISELSNSILVSVDNDDPKKSAELQARISGDIEDILKNDSINGAVLSQSVSHNNDEERLADKYGITIGKAQLISKIISSDKRYTFEQLVPLSINELNLLCSSGSEISETVGAVGTASDKKYIGIEKAKEEAVKAAGLDASQITGFEWDMDYEYSFIVYEIEFRHGGREYEYDVNALTGEVLKGGADRDGNDDIDDAPITSSPNDYIGSDAAKAAALSHAGIEEADARDISVELDRENGRAVYEVDFESGKYEYSYEIDAESGKIIKSEKERED